MRPLRAGLCRDAVAALLVFAVALALAASLRYRLIEPASLAHTCSADPAASLCWLRAWIVRGFQHQEPGWIAAIAGLTGWILAPRGDGFRKAGSAAGPRAVAITDRTQDPVTPSVIAPIAWRIARLSGLLALASGATGLMLYSFDPAAVGLVLGLITLTRVSTARHDG